MDLDEIQAFISVADAGGFAAAGRARRLPRSTLSKQVRRLEENLGVRLLQRTTRRVALTEAGRVLYEQSSDAIARLAAAQKAARDLTLEPSGTLRVSSVSLGDALAAVLPLFNERYPKIKLIIDLSERRVDLLHDNYDVALRGGALPDSSLMARKICPSAILLCASPGYLHMHGCPQSLADLRKHTGVTYGPLPSGNTLKLDTPDGRKEATFEHWLTANDFGLLTKLTVAGMGVGLLESVSASKDLQAGSLVRVLPEVGLEAGGGLYAVYPSRKHVSAAVRAFVDFMAVELPKVLLG
jgi:DNA-binding transcriptional LysR family regulator